MNKFKVEYLADRPDCIQACAAWAYGRWGVQQNAASLDRALEVFSQGAQKNAIPLTLVTINLESDLPVAMASLWERDGTHWPDKTPWIASIYTLYRYRNLGLARNSIKCLEHEAMQLGFKQLYLQSGSAADLYRGLGYNALETIETTATAAGTLTLFVKALN